MDDLSDYDVLDLVLNRMDQIEIFRRDGQHYLQLGQAALCISCKTLKAHALLKRWCHCRPTTKRQKTEKEESSGD